MADTPGTSSTSSPPPVLPETLRAEINNAFNQWQWIAGELSSLQDHELHSPLPLLTLTQDQQDYLNHLCNVINRTLDSLFNTQQTLERDLATERLLKTAVDNQLSTQLQLTQLLQSQLAQNPPGAPAQVGLADDKLRRTLSPFEGRRQD
ncbi:hypothetical protein DID88_007728 [Monilinia fructigena]|uniref:Uncharacterized protein n=1 Tax=Monilinia fructigena TaxID=38457 RepID=A0A395J3U7_9HELO|nr:hypothetical protein DID88_007728 [Monilinia fructigena]